ncbi:MAG: hypothetical protein IJE08_15200 [Clostridia bacterium]|nr:hypothetical protein [Clostridia bacterium]
MDYRKALEAGSVLDFPGMQCTLEEEVGRGSNAIVYRGWYPDLLNPGQRHIVLIKELFPFHIRRGIYRGDDLSIVRTEEGISTWETHRRSFEYGNEAHLRLLEKYPDQIGANLNTYALNATHYTVLGFTGGRSLEQEFSGPAANLRQLARMMLGVLDALESFHESGLLHLDIAPDNILLIGRAPKERVMLIDYNSVYDMNAAAAAPHFSVKAGYTAPEVCKGSLRSIREAADLYSAAAVFYRLLTGTALTAFQTVRPTPPDASGCECLRNMPDTVRSMVNAILRRGLQTMPRMRYGSVQEMREAFEELIDRIDGVGVTHWALWEAGKRSVDRTIRENPAYAFIKEETKLLPVNAESEDNGVVPVNEYIEGLTGQTGGGILLTAPGGMGKTTAMLRAVHGQAARYSPQRSAIAYVSLTGWKDGQGPFIQNRILETLHYKTDTHSYEDARHILMQLLDAPIRTKDGDRPVLLILLDGLNEATGNTAALNEEILALSQKQGVRLLVSSRSDGAELPFEKVSLRELTEEDVSSALAEDGLLMPEDAGMQALLKTPLMLSIFREASAAEEKQLSVQTQDELMKAYMNALIRKELSRLPDDADERWRIEAAVHYVLPALAAEIQKRDGLAGDRELLTEAEKCFRLFASRILRNAFPEWIGRSAAIRGDAENAEQWYGEIVHGLLWKRMGLLVRGDGGYRIAHQIIGEYLLGVEKVNHRRIARRQAVQRGLIGAAVLAALVLAALGYRELIRPQPYSAQLADTVINYGLKAYRQAGDQYEIVRELMDCVLETPGEYESAKWMYDNQAERMTLTGVNGEMALAWANRMLESGKVMPGSLVPMDGDRYTELIGLYEARTEEYAWHLSVVDYLMNNEKAYEMYAESYLPLLDQLIETDADIAATLYQIACMQHAEGMYELGSAERESYTAVAAANSRMKTHFAEGMDAAALTARLNEAQALRNSLSSGLYSHGAAGKFDW